MIGIVMSLQGILIAADGNWPQFLGPGRDGVARDATGLLRKWPEGGPKKLWTVQLGEGFGSPIVLGDSVYILDRAASKKDILRRLKLSDGSEVWNYSYDAPGKVDYNGSRSSPACDGERIYSIGPFGHVTAVNVADGSLVWKAHLLEDWGGKRPNWGIAQSPLLFGGKVIMAPWGKEGAVIARRPATGEVIWATPNPKKILMDYQSPVTMTLDGKATVVASGGNGYTLGVDSETGAQLWEYAGYFCMIHIPSPTIVDATRILLTGGYNAGSQMISIEKEGDAFKPKLLWKDKTVASKIPQPIIINGHIYSNSSDLNGAFRCVTLDGKQLWDSKDAGVTFDMGNFILADGLIYIIDGKTGTLRMIEPSPEGYKELGKTEGLLSGPEAWSPPVYADGKLLIRDKKKMVCVEVK